MTESSDTTSPTAHPTVALPDEPGTPPRTDGRAVLALVLAVIRNGARIDGNVQAENARPVKVRGSKVFGEVQADRGGRVVGNEEGQCRNF
jgi:hypothetical protein